jgi:hypothetical protein
MIKKVLIFIILLLPVLSYSQFNVSTKPYNDKKGWFLINLPEGFKLMIGDPLKELMEKNKILFDRKIDPYNNIHIFNNSERLLIIKTYREAVSLNRDKAMNSVREFETSFNEKMKKQNQPYFINYDNFKIEEKDSNTFFIFYGKGDLYLKGSSFIHAVINLPERRSIVIYGFLNGSEKNYLDNVYLNSILSIQPKTPNETEEVQTSSKNPLDKKWFRYLILFGIAVAVTLLYNKYAKQKQVKPVDNTEKKNDGKN